MFNAKFIVSITIFIIFLVLTSAVKNKTRVIEKQIAILKSKVSAKKNNINEAQLDFFYLSSPSEIEKKLNIIGLYKYKPINYSNIYFNIHDFTKIKNNITNLKKINEEKIQKK